MTKIYRFDFEAQGRGAWITSDASDFASDFAGLVEQFGKPTGIVRSDQCVARENPMVSPSQEEEARAFERVEQDERSLVEEELCHRCSVSPCGEMRFCPYDQDVNNKERLCGCCAGCRHECAQDV